MTKGSNSKKRVAAVPTTSATASNADRQNEHGRPVGSTSQSRSASASPNSKSRKASSPTSPPDPASQKSSPNPPSQKAAQDSKSQKKASPMPGDNKKSRKHRQHGKSKFQIPTPIWIGIAAVVSLAILKYYSEQSQRFGGFGSNRTSVDPLSHYEVLGVARKSSPSVIRQAYMKLAKENHPDTCPDCADTFQRIATAYQILSNPTSRQVYDSAESDINLITSQAVKISLDNIDEVLGGRHPVVIIQVYNDWSYESTAFASMWERAVEKLGPYMTFARLHETKDASLISRLIPVRTRLIPALAAFIRGKFQRLISTGIKYSELDANLVGVYPDKVVPLQDEDSIVKFASDRCNFIAFTQSGKPSMVLKHAALLFDGVLNIGVTSIPARSVYQSLQVAEPPNQRSLLLSQNYDGKRFWRAISSPDDLIASLRSDLAGQVPILSSSWQYNALCRLPNADCIVAVNCKSSNALANKDFIAESRAFRAKHLQAPRPIQFAIADFREARGELCPQEAADSVVIALQDATKMSRKPGSVSLDQFFSNCADTDSRAELTWSFAPMIHERRSSGRWKWNWLLGIALFAAGVFVITSFWSNMFMVVAMTVLMASSIIFQFDWIMPLLRSVFKF